MARSIAEVGSLIHVEPESIEPDELLLELSQLVAPPSRSVRVEEVGEHSIIGPYSALERLIAAVHLQEHVLLHTKVIGAVILTWSHGNTCIDDGNELDTLVVEEIINVFGQVAKVQGVN